MSDLATEAAKTANHPLCYLEIAWDDAVAVSVADARGAAGWTDETAYLIGHSGKVAIQPAGEVLTQAGDIGALSVVLDNSTGRFNWQDASAPLYGYVSGPLLMAGKPIRVWQGFQWSEAGVLTQDYACIFTGVITGFTPETFAARLTLECRDWGYRYLQQKASSTLQENLLASDWIAALCLAAGITTYTIATALNRIPWVWLDDESYIEEIWAVAEACGGLAYFDQSGRFIFETAVAIIQHSLTLDWDFTEDDYQTPDPELNVEAVCSEVIVEVLGRETQELAVVYTLDAMKPVGPGATVTFTARFNNPCQGANLASAYDLGDDEKHVLVINANGDDATASCTITLSPVYAQQADVTILNTTDAALRLVKLDLAGYPLIGRPAEQIKAQATTTLPFVRTRSLRTNPYVQTLAMANSLVAMLACRLGQVRPIYKLTGVPGVPTLRLNDVVRFRNTLAQGADNRQTGIISGISWEWGRETGFRQDFAVMDLANLTPGNYTDFFVIGVTALGAHGRCYF